MKKVNSLLFGLALLGSALSMACGKGADQADHDASSIPPNDKAVVWIKGPAGDLCAYAAGSGGVPVVFVHSLGGEWQQWLDQIYHLAENRQVVAFDMRGHGKSVDGATLKYDHAAMVADLAAVVDYFKLERFVLVGHSFGGSVCAAYAGAHPEQLAGILFVDPAGDVRKVPKSEIEPFLTALESDQYAQVIQDYYRQIMPSSSEDVRTEVLSALEKTHKQAVLGAFQSMLSFDVVSALNQYDGPMFSVVSELAANDSTALHNVLPNLPHTVMRSTGHWPHMDRPEVFNRHMDAFLTRL